MPAAEDEELTLMVNGRPVRARPGVSIAAACLKANLETPVDVPRIFCGMGSCYSCLADVDGRLCRTCITPAADGMNVTISTATGAEANAAPSTGATRATRENDQ